MSDELNKEMRDTNGSAPLSRQVTLSLSPEQYERLFFQPTGAKGDLAKRLGNPTLLGVLGFLVPYSCTMFCFLEFKGSNSTSIVSVSGSWYFFGGIAMNVAAICEFILGNTFPFTVFMIVSVFDPSRCMYGVHWVNIAYTSDPSHPLAAAYYVAAGGAAESAVFAPYTSGQGHYNVIMAMVSFVFLLGSLRTNVPFVIVFFTLIILFGCIAGAEYELGYNPTAAGAEYAAKLLKVGGGFGFIAMIMGWYLAIITACASTGVPCPLPIFDLSQKVFAHNKAQTGEHAGSVPANAVREA